MDSSDDEGGEAGQCKLQYNMNDLTGTIIRIQNDFGFIAFSHEASANPEMYAFFDEPTELIETPGTSLYSQVTFEAQYLDDTVDFPEVGTCVRWIASNVAPTGSRLDPVVLEKEDPFVEDDDKGIREVDLVFMSLHAKSACDVYAAEDKDVHWFKKITDKLNYICRIRDPIGKTDLNPVVNGVYAAKFGDTAEWARVLVKALPSANQVEVQYLDSGEIGTLGRDAIVPIGDQAVPFFCRRFRMVGCGKPDCSRARKKARQMLHRVFQEPVVKGITCTYNGNMLLDIKNKRDRSLAETLLSKGYCSFDQDAWCLAFVHQLNLHPPPHFPVPIQDALMTPGPVNDGFIAEDGVFMVTRSPPIERKVKKPKEFGCPFKVVRKSTAKVAVPEGDKSLAGVYAELVHNKRMVDKVRNICAAELEVTRNLIKGAPSDDGLTSELQILLAKIEWLLNEFQDDPERVQSQLVEDMGEFVRRYDPSLLEPIVRSLRRLENFVPEEGSGDLEGDLSGVLVALDDLEEEPRRIKEVTEEAVARVQRAFDAMKNMEVPPADETLDLKGLMAGANNAVVAEIRILTKDLPKKRLGLLQRTYEGLMTMLQQVMEQQKNYEHFVDIIRVMDEP